jgi:hypothetical protein
MVHHDKGFIPIYKAYNKLHASARSDPLIVKISGRRSCGWLLSNSPIPSLSLSHRGPNLLPLLFHLPCIRIHVTKKITATIATVIATPIPIPMSEISTREQNAHRFLPGV